MSSSTSSTPKSPQEYYAEELSEFWKQLEQNKNYTISRNSSNSSISNLTSYGQKKLLGGSHRVRQQHPIYLKQVRPQSLNHLNQI